MKDREANIISMFKSAHIGDDGAFIDGYCYSMDSFFEDVHFKREWMSMAQIGRKAMLVNLSDAISMNAQPLFALLSLALPKDIKQYEAEELTTSLQECAKEYSCEIIGGDTISSDKIAITITIVAKSVSPLFRKGLQSGDFLAYTGILGESKRDLEKLFRGEKVASNSRFYEPTLRRDFVAKAREYLSCGMDISDGLFCDTNKLLDVNSCGLEIIQDISDEVGMSGEEYEMLVGFKEKNLSILQNIAKELHVPLTLFARVKENSFRFDCKNHHF